MDEEHLIRRDPWVMVSATLHAQALIEGIKRVGMFYLLLSTAAAFIGCLPGSAECNDKIMKICDVNKKWVILDCPGSTSCMIKGGKVGCQKMKEQADAESEEEEKSSKKKDRKKDKQKKIKFVSDSWKEQAPKTVTVTEKIAPKEIRLEYTMPGKVEPVAARMQSNGKDETSFAPSGGGYPQGGAPGSVSPNSAGQPGGGGTPSSMGQVPGSPSTPQQPASSIPGSTPQQSPQPTSTSQPVAQPTASTQSQIPTSSQPSSTPPQTATGGQAQTAKLSTGDGKTAGGKGLTADVLGSVLKSMNLQPKPEYLNAFIEGANKKITDPAMRAIAAAQMAHETGGFSEIEEVACKNGCAGNYGVGAPGKSYHGRGFIQLSWPDNYKKAGAALGMGNRLFEQPELVVKDLKMAFDVSYWYWTEVVEKVPEVKAKKGFGYTTKAINGTLECKGQNLDKAKKRYEIYKAICKKLGIEPIPEGGCYN